MVKIQACTQGGQTLINPENGTGGLTSLEVCAGAGGQALGLEQAGFAHAALVENDPYGCATLRLNRPEWNVLEEDLREFSGLHYRDRIDLLAGGVPCPPFSIAGQRLGAGDERDLFPEMLRLAREVQPQAVMIENVRGLLAKEFGAYREDFSRDIESLGYKVMGWRLLNASDFGVSQLRPRTIFIALQEEAAEAFAWPAPTASGTDGGANGGMALWDEGQETPTVGEALYDLMASGGWPGAEEWRDRADKIAPTLVGGSRKHGGPDLGPTRAKRQWDAMGVNGRLIADAPPGPDFEEVPCLTVRMAARLQGFPDDWQFTGRKTASYRQIGNAFPPPVACAVGVSIARALSRVQVEAIEAAEAAQ